MENIFRGKIEVESHATNFITDPERNVDGTFVEIAACCRLTSLSNADIDYLHKGLRSSSRLRRLASLAKSLLV